MASGKARPQHAQRHRALVDWTVASALRALVDSCAMFRSRAMGGLLKWKLDGGTIAEFRAMFGYPNTVQNGLASNMTTRLAVGRAWVHQALGMLKVDPNRCFYMATVFDDRIRTSEVQTVIQLSAFVARVRGMLNDAGIADWLSVIEFQPYNNGRRGLGGDLSPHMHVLLWLSEPMEPKMLEQLEGDDRFVSLSGAPSVVVTERLSTRGQIAHWAQYIFKAPERAANVVASRTRPGGSVSRDAFLRPIYAIRLMEILSQLTLKELIFAGGEGLDYRSKLINVIERRSVHSRGWPMRSTEAAIIWGRARHQAERINRPPVQFG